MKRRDGFKVAGMVALLFFCGIFPSRTPAEALGPEKGKILERVVCDADAQQSYAFYLPSGYTPEKKWPILYAFDPAGRGMVPVKLFAELAEEYGWILVASNNSRNGPWEIAVAAARAMWQETMGKLAIDKKRIYVCGFSGGARVAVAFSRITAAPVAGIIACGAGIPEQMPAAQVAPMLHIALVGNRDFNFIELWRLDREFDDTQVIHRRVVFDGEHQWPPPEAVQQAAEWLELYAMANGTRSRDDRLLEKWWQGRLALAEETEKTGNVLQARRDYLDLVSDFRGFRDVSGLERITVFLKESLNYLPQLHDEERMIEKELSILKAYQQVIREMYAYPVNPAERRRIVAGFHIPALKKQAAETGNFNASCMASRLLGKIVINAQEVSMDFWGQKEYRRAAWFLELALQTGMEKWYHRYNLACVYVKLAEKKKALNIIASLIEMGFDQVGALENDPDLAPLLKEKEFRELLDRMKHKK